MAEKVIKATIQLRRATEDKWNEIGSSFIPKEGEPCLTLDGENAGKVKYGDGTNTWSNLLYSSGGNSVSYEYQSLTEKQKNQARQNISAASTDDLNNKITNPSNGKVNQVLAIKSVNEEGTPIEWKLIDYINFNGIDHGDFSSAILKSTENNDFFLWILETNDFTKPIFHIGNSIFIDCVGAIIDLTENNEKYLLTFEVNGGEPIDSLEVNSGTIIDLNNYTPIKNGYIFKGWYKENSFENIVTTVTLTSNVTIYAKWEEEIEEIDNGYFKYSVKLTEDNQTVYVPITLSNRPEYNAIVNWGDNSNETPINTGDSVKSISHIYNGNIGDIFQITITGVVSVLNFSSTFGNTNTLYSLDESTLKNQMELYILSNSNLKSIKNNALNNIVLNSGFADCRSLEILEENAFSGCTIKSLNKFFYQCPITYIPSSFKQAISQATGDASYMFYSTGDSSGTLVIPGNLFDTVQDNSLTDFTYMFRKIINYVSGDAKELYDVLKNKATAEAITDKCFSLTGLSNINQVPTSWGGTME